MGKVTKIEKQKKDGRVNVYIDGAFHCGMDEFTALKNRVREGAEFSLERLKEIAFEADSERALNKAFGILNKRPRTEKQIRTYLKEKLFMQEAIDNAVTKLYEHKYLDDREYAKIFISFHRRNWGKKRIVMELKADGVSTEIIDELYEETEGQASEVFELAKKYVRQKGGYDRSKIFNYLYSKGFLTDDIYEGLRQMAEYIAETENEETDD